MSQAERPVLGTLSALAERIEGRVVGDGSVPIDRIVAIVESTPGALTFATDARYFRAALDSRASAVIVDERIANETEGVEKPLLIVPSARIALARLLTSFEPPVPKGPFTHPTAVVDPTASIGDGVVLGPLCIIGARAKIGARSVIDAGAVVGDDAILGEDCRLRPRAMLLERCIAGNRVILQPGAIVGSDGFGYVPVEMTLLKIPQIGNVELDDDVEIGANTCVDRAQTGTTKIGAQTKIDNLVQLGHNVRIGKMTVIAGGTVVAGSARIGDFVQIGGHSAINGHIEIGQGVKIAGASRVWESQPDGATVSGDPAQDHRTELRKKVQIKNLSKLFARVAALEKEAQVHSA